MNFGGKMVGERQMGGEYQIHHQKSFQSIICPSRETHTQTPAYETGLCSVILIQAPLLFSFFLCSNTIICTYIHTPSSQFKYCNTFTYVHVYISRRLNDTRGI